MPFAPLPSDQPRLAGVELGGTKAIAVLADGARIIDRLVVPTTTPGATLGALAEQIARWDAEASIAALGIASFGPIRLAVDAPDFG